MGYSEKQVMLIETAEKLFSEKGFAGTSVRDIAEHSKMNLAMISYYFGSKDKLLEAVFAYRGENTKQVLQGMLDDKSLDPFEKFYKLIDYYLERFRKNVCFYRIMVREQLMDTKGELAEMMLTFKRNNLEMVRLLVQEGQKKKLFRKDIDVPMMMSTIIGTINHVLSTPHYFRVIAKLENLTDDELEDHLIKHLRTHLKKISKAILTNEE